MCRCSTALETSVKEKISMFCHVEPEQVRHWRTFLSLSPASLTSSELTDPSPLRSSVCTTCRPSTKCRYCWSSRAWWATWAGDSTCPSRPDPGRCWPSGRRCLTGETSNRLRLYSREGLVLNVLLTSTLPPQVGQTPGALLYRSGGEVHQVLRLVCFSHQSSGALSSRHQPQTGG